MFVCANFLSDCRPSRYVPALPVSLPTHLHDVILLSRGQKTVAAMTTMMLVAKSRRLVVAWMTVKLNKNVHCVVNISSAKEITLVLL